MSDEIFNKIVMVAITVIVTSFLNAIISYVATKTELFKNWKAKKKKEPFEKLEEKDKSFEETINSLENFQQLMSNALLASIRIELLEGIEKAIKNNYISVERKDAMQQLHAAYNALGGNSFIETLWPIFDNIQVVANSYENTNLN